MSAEMAVEPATQLFCTDPGPVLIDSTQAPVVFAVGRVREDSAPAKCAGAGKSDERDLAGSTSPHATSENLEFFRTNGTFLEKLICQFDMISLDCDVIPWTR